MRAWVVAFLLAGCVGADSGPAPSRVEAYLSPASGYTSILVEFDHATRPPSKYAVDELAAALRELTRRPVATTSSTPIGDDLAAPGSDGWSSQELSDLARATLTSADPGAFGRGTVAVIHVLYLDGEWEERPTAAGLASDVAAFLFIDFGAAQQTLRRGDGPSVAEIVEREVLLHEVGHLLGLVNNGLPMQRPHEDPESEGHSSNKESVMYSGADYFDVQMALLAPEIDPARSFDADDLADVAAYRDASTK